MVLAGAQAMASGNKSAATTDSLKTVKLQEVQVYSTRAGSRTPMAYTNVGKQELKQLNHGMDIPFLLSLTPSVTFTSDAGNAIGYTSLRVRGTDPTRINITSNGIPMNDAESANIIWVNMCDFASSVESMQVQRGVGTSTNGAAAFGATVNMQTENIGVKPFASLDLSGGSYNSHKETFRFGTGLLGGHWGFQGRLSNIGSDGYVDRAWSKLNSYFLQGGYFSDNTVVKLVTFNGTEQTYHAWNYTSKYEQSLYGRRYNSCGAIFDDDYNIKGYYDNQTDNYHQQHYQLIWNQTISNKWNLNTALHYTKGTGYYEQYKAGRTLAKYNLTTDWNKYSDLVEQKKMDNDFFGVVASFNYNSRTGLLATIGGGWNRYIGDHFGNVAWVKQFDEDFMPGQQYYFNTTRKNDGNIYGKVSYEFLPGLSAYVDMQYRHVNTKMTGTLSDWSDKQQVQLGVNEDYDFFNPKAGLYYNIDKLNTVYVSFAVGHREPTRNDYENYLGAKLKGERLLDWELGYKFTAQRFSAGVNLYYMDYNNQFVLTGELDHNGEPVAKNVGNSYRMGTELQAAWTPLDWFRWDANATLSRNRAKDWTVEADGADKPIQLGDTPLSFSPDFIFNNVFSFNYRGFRAAVQSQYISSQYLTNTGYKQYQCDGKDVSMMIDAHFTTNVDLSYTFRLKSLKSATVGLTVYNLFSSKYDNNGWASPSFKVGADGKLQCYADDLYEAGFAPSAPFNVMAHLSLNF